MKKIFLLMTMMLSIVLLFSGCGLFPSKTNYKNDKSMSSSDRKNYYDDDEAIRSSDDEGSMSTSNQNIDDSNNIIYKASKLDGFVALGEVSVPSETKTTMHFSIAAKSGKAKLVLLRPDLKVEVLKEIIADKDGRFDGDVSFVCPKGVCKLKIVGDNFGGECKISQTNVVFKELLGHYLSHDNGIVYNAKRLDGSVEFGEANVSSDINAMMNVVASGTGKAKLVLVRPDATVEVLKEFGSANDSSFVGNISFTCPKGVCKLKMIGENFSGNCVISNMNVLFKKTTWEREK